MFWNKTNQLVMFFPEVFDCQFQSAEGISVCASAGSIPQLSAEGWVDLLSPAAHSGWVLTSNTDQGLPETLQEK